MADAKEVSPEDAFEKLGGPTFEIAPRTTKGGTLYLTHPSVALLSQPLVTRSALEPFLAGFPPDLGFEAYVDDEPIGNGSEEATELIKLAGQTCYMSFGENRTKNRDAQKYVDNILASGHGSVLEHAQFTFLLWGCDRSFTHELVRHRTGVAFSQVSQRYVDGKVLRFVERPEYQTDDVLHTWFEDRIDRSTREYAAIAERLIERQLKGDTVLSGEKRTELRKKVNQAARSCLPNETEAPIVFSGNIRALRHICEMRASGAADVPIREVTTRIFLAMRHIEPTLFNDYKLLELPDGTYSVQTQWRKV
jgi:thymidylate synthase (FAD)